MKRTNQQTSATIATVDCIGHVYDRGYQLYEKKSKYNDTRDDIMDGIEDACTDALEFLAFESDIVASFDSAISFAFDMRAQYEKTTNYHDFEYYRAYRSTMLRIRRWYMRSR